jgi:hypothetical protein
MPLNSIKLVSLCEGKSPNWTIRAARAQSALQKLRERLTKDSGEKAAKVRDGGSRSSKRPASTKMAGALACG